MTKTKNLGRKLIKPMDVEFLGGIVEFKEYYLWASVCSQKLRYICTDFETGHSVYETKEGTFILVI